jgi:hypothetical protein
MIPVANTYFSGAGLMDIGLEQAGVKIQQSFEMDELCCQTARANFSHEVIQADICLKTVKADRPCDVMVGTYLRSKLAKQGGAYVPLELSKDEIDEVFQMPRLSEAAAERLAQLRDISQSDSDGAEIARFDLWTEFRLRLFCE